jgi:diguanylate cyclase (GGDEF)-like protein
MDFIFHYVLIPGISLFIVLTLVELITRTNKAAFNIYIIIFSGAFLTSVIVFSHPTVRGIESALLLPIFASCIYFKKQPIIFATCTTLISFLVVISIEPAIEIYPIYLVTMCAIFITAGVLSISIMNRGIELLEQLSKSSKSSQDLMVSKILMEKLSKTDALTNIYNHRAFQEYTDDLIQHSEEISIHLAIIDIDNFKHVNDTYGHQVGDLILRFAADTIKESVCNNDFLARYGGEEFIIVLVDQSQSEAIDCVEQIRMNIYQAEHPSLNNERISVSIGLSTYTHTMTKNEWFNAADQALYKAKQTGKNKVEISERI